MHQGARWCLAIVMIVGCSVTDEDMLDDEDALDADTAYEGDDADDEGDDERISLAASTSVASLDEATVAQVNPYYGGRFSTLDRSGPVTYETARRFARYVRDRWPRLSVIGMQEIADPANASQLAVIMTEITGRPWAAQHFGRATGPDALPSTEEAILWRTDMWMPVENFGTRQVAAVDTSRGPRTLSVRFGGMLLRRNGTTHHLAVFTGKLTWGGKRTDGRLLTNEDRAVQAKRLMAWIDDKLAGHPHATRVIAVDVNAHYIRAPWDMFRRRYGDGGDDRPTFGARRIDGLFWDYDAGPKRSDNFGFVGGPYRSAMFGSDHRAVAARIRLR